MPTVNVNGASLEYVETGTGEPVVLVHGSFSDHRIWEHQWDAFGRHHRTIAYSRRYHWPNAPIPPNADYAMLEHVDDLQVFLTEVGAAPAHLLGNSYGAFLCLLLAIREPGLVRSLVLNEPPVVPLIASVPPKAVDFLKLVATRPRMAAGLVKFFVAGIRPATAAFARDDLDEGMRLFLNAALAPRGFQSLSEAQVERARANTFKAEFVGSGFAPLDPEHVRRITTPTLLLTGGQSPPLLRLLTDLLHELVPHGERVDIPGAAHATHEDNPSAYNAAVLAFLARHTSSPSAA